MTTTNILNIYPSGNLDKAKYVGQIEISDNSKNAVSAFNSVETIILLDISGSMGSNVEKIIKCYLPDALESIGFSSLDMINLVTFSTNARCYSCTLDILRSSTLRATGNTHMRYGIDIISNVIANAKTNKIRILAISDGELNDQNETVLAANNLASKLKTDNYVISCRVIRLQTSSYGRPDTRGLSSLLQLSTTLDGSEFIVDLKESDEASEITKTMANLLTDTLQSRTKILSEELILLSNPWSLATDELHLQPGVNTFWLTEMPALSDLHLKSGDLKLQFEIVEGQKLDFSSYNSVLKDKVDFFITRLRILKVVNTASSQAEIESILKYFQNLESYFSMNDQSTSDLLANPGLKSRLAFFREVAKKKSRSVSMRMAEIANDDKVSQLNSCQQADYLRTTSASSNSRQLAKRALKQGLDFDTVAINSVKEMKMHINELADIDDTNHYVSFYSQETTLQGIKTVCALDDDEKTLDNMSALDILQLLNIVGIPCRGPVGDFPDPKTYHLEELMLSSFVSMADVLMVKSGGHVLRHPYGDKKEILNVIPFYDDDRIQQFLMKYAPVLLEYVASLGMRNMIIDIPHTYKYTIVGGLWNMAIRLNDQKSEINTDIFTKLVVTYKTAVDGHFDYVVNLIKEQSKEDADKALSFYISNNGTTNMMSPLITIMEKASNGDMSQSKYAPDILRALYSFEYYQTIRKICKSDSDKLAKRKELLDKLLGINFELHGTPLPAHFEARGSPKRHYDKPDIDQDLLQTLSNRIPWIDTITLLPELLKCSFGGAEGKKKITELPELTSYLAETHLNIYPKMTLKTFKFNCIVQSFMFPDKASRVVNGVPECPPKMKIQDCGDVKAMSKMIGNYIEAQYRAHYQSQLSKKEKEEREMLTQELVNLMTMTSDIDEFVELFKSGLRRNHVTTLIADTHQLGFVSLKDKLFDPNINVPLRSDKLWIFVMGTTKDNAIVWNKGNVLRMPLLLFQELFEKLSLSAMWNEMYEMYQEKNIYIYRSGKDGELDMPNRHTHCNSKASYWAFGYSTVGKYFADISEMERDAYLRTHTHCCGIWDGKLVKLA